MIVAHKQRSMPRVHLKAVHWWIIQELIQRVLNVGICEPTTRLITSEEKMEAKPETTGTWSFLLNDRQL